MPLKDDVSLIDGVARNRRNKNFQIPSVQERETIPLGSYAKIGTEGPEAGERFWVIVKEHDSEGYVGMINNDLVRTEKHGLACDELIRFGPDNVLSWTR